MIFLSLFFTFLQVGVFGFGGDYGMLALIQSETVVQHGWLTSAEFANIVALSRIAPGSVGINSAAYCGYAVVRNAGYDELMGVLGGGVATLGVLLPAFIIMVLVCRMLMKYMHTVPVQSMLSGLRPAVVGLVGAAALMLMNAENFSSPSQNPWQFWISVAIFAATYIGVRVLKINPLRMLGWAAFAGLMLLY